MTKRISKMLNDGGKNSVIGTHNLAISEDGIVDRSKHTEAKTQFKAIDTIVENKEHIYIYVNANSAHIIPIRIFVNEAEKNDFLAFLQQRIGRIS
ncbi:YcxB family protein [Desulfosporosinus burensis]